MCKKKNKFKKELLKLLDEAEIIDKIKKIVANENMITPQAVDYEQKIEYQEYKAQHEQLKEQNNQLKAKHEQLEEQHKQVEGNYTQLKNEYEQHKAQHEQLEEQHRQVEGNYTQLKNKYDQHKAQHEQLDAKNLKMIKDFKAYKARFDDIQIAFDEYKKCPENIKTSIENILSGGNPVDLLINGVQDNTIESIWSLIKDKYIEDKTDEIKHLHKVFKIIITRYMAATKKIKQQTVNVDDEFDTELHIRHRAGKVSGNISKIILQGYINSITGKVIKKSLVYIS